VSSKPTDRRVRRTRQLLRSALLSLIEEKGYERITVQDILDRADVGRSTFYAHYRDKDDLLRSGFEEIRSTLTEEPGHPAMGEGKPDFLDPMVVVFRHVDAHRALWRPLVRKGGADLVLRMLRESVTDLVREHFRTHFDPEGDLRVEAALQFVVGACMSLVIWWPEEERDCLSPEEMHSIFRGLAMQGVRRFLTAS
jgi:AcrR family transcriptional regulator